MRSKRGSWLRASPAILLFVVAVYVGMKVIPVVAATYQLDDTVREQVVRTGARRLRVSDEEIRGIILGRARELDLPVTERSIIIRRTDNTIQIEVSSAVTIRFFLEFSYDWTFNIDHEGPSF